jgi:VWFA-related protein
MNTMPRCRFFLALLAVASGLAPAQETTIRTQSNVVIIPALVKSKKGELVSGLKAGDFVVEDDGAEQPVHLDDASEESQLSIVVAIQTGRRAGYEFPRVRGLGAMLGPLQDSGFGRVAIVQFGSQVQLIQDFSSSSDRTSETLRGLHEGDGGAAILDAVDYSIKLLEKSPPQRRRVLLLISETRDHGSKSKIDKVVEEIGESSAAVYALAFSPSKSNVLDTMRGNNIDEMNPTPDLLAPIYMAAQAMKRNTPKAVASMTGGEYELFATQKAFDARMVDFTNHVHNRYMLSIEPKNPHPGLHQLRVRLRDGGDSVVLARTSYWVKDEATEQPTEP